MPFYPVLSKTGDTGLNLMLVWIKNPCPVVSVVEISVTRLHSTMHFLASPRARAKAGSVPNLFLSLRLAESAPLERLYSCRCLTLICINDSRGLKVCNGLPPVRDLRDSTWEAPGWNWKKVCGNHVSYLPWWMFHWMKLPLPHKSLQ